MFSKALSEQSCVREGAGYDEVYLLGRTDLGTSYLKRDLSTNSPSEEEDEDSDSNRLKSDMEEISSDVESYESPLKTAVGPDDLRNFILPLIWTVNDFSSNIQRKHFNTLRDRY